MQAGEGSGCDEASAHMPMVAQQASVGKSSASAWARNRSVTQGRSEGSKSRRPVTSW
jgi:hypothetical protein